MGLIQLETKLTASAMLNNMHRHQGDVSEGTQHRPIASRWILGHRCSFFADGTHTIDGIDITAEDEYASEILRFAHASLITGGPVGDKAKCWVDATVDPAIVWIHGLEARDLIRSTAAAVLAGDMPVGVALDDSIQTSSDTVKALQSVVYDVGAY